MRIFLIFLLSWVGIACGSDAGGDNQTGPDGGINPGSDGGASDSDASMPMSRFVDPSCVDGMYQETLPNVNADISDLSFTGDISAFVDAVLGRRYPVGADLVAGGRTNPNFEDCDILFSGSPANTSDLIDRMVYLDGNPDDQIFEGGDQGFNLLFEEAVQYVNSLSTSWAFVDQMDANRRTSARDGILTHLWWIQRYLRMARLQYPKAYQRITNPCWRDAILTLWGRAWMYLEATENMTPLGIDDAAILELVSDVELLGEIERLRELEGC